MHEDEFVPDFNSYQDINQNFDGHPIFDIPEVKPEFTQIKFNGKEYTVNTEYYEKSMSENRKFVYVRLDQTVEFVTEEELEVLRLKQTPKLSRAQRRKLQRGKK